MDLKEKILKNAGELFKEKGIRLVTMDSIALKMGISKRTIYENFKDKDDLLSNFLSESMVVHQQRVIEVLNNSSNVIEALFNFGVVNFMEMEKISPVFFDDLKKYHSDIFSSVLQKGMAKNHELSFTMLSRGQKEGVFITDIDLDISNKFIHNMLDFCQRENEPGDCNNEMIWKSVMLPYLRGICSVKGLTLLEYFKEQSENNENI